jgi:hypothetical protein
MHDASIGGSMNLILCHRRSAQEVSTSAENRKLRNAGRRELLRAPSSFLGVFCAEKK